MSDDQRNIENRRRFLKIVGSSAVLGSVLGIAGCSGGNDAAPEKADCRIMVGNERIALAKMIGITPE